MVRRKKYVPSAPLSLREMIRNMIKTTRSTYTGKEYTTSLDSLYFLMHGTPREEVFEEVSKWVDLNGVGDETEIVLPTAFFE